MFKNTPFEAIAKTMSESAPKFNATSIQDAVKPVQENLKAWADLAQHQAKEVQAVIAETMASIKDVKDPQAAFEIMKASAEAGMAMFAQNLKEVTSLSVGQFHSTVDAVEKAHPAPEAFAPVAKNLKAAATTVETTLDSVMEKGAAAVASASKAKKAR
ncbi:MAG: hypothetical protein PHQ58_17155 [Rhodoferax sp.]|uniref:hypothetical protein n=1 Tax=Rhodoferax sp. TaxID=50421 RepID=UPI0026281983|nr:hypothetical protein [Rhodoferax sp.]MDD2882157.1 hypothetical protein [Rhodoferax sp.]